MRLEQLAPIPSDALRDALAPFGDVPLTWVQEEPLNQGAWGHLAMNLPRDISARLHVLARPASASPAAGTMKRHLVEQRELLDRAFARDTLER